MTQKSAISILQELMVLRHHPMPIYEFERIGNLVEPKFLCTVKVASVCIVGESKNKKEAKEKAAERALHKLQFTSQASTETRTLPCAKTFPQGFVTNINYVGKLNEFASGRGYLYAQYEDTLVPVNGQFKVNCKFQGIQVAGYGTTKKQAKQVAAHLMLLRLKSIDLPSIEHDKLNCKTVLECNSKDEEIVRHFEKLSFNHRKIETNQKIETNREPLIDFKNGEFSLSEAKNYLSKSNIPYRIVILQKHPYCVSVILSDREITTMGFNGEQNEATKMALNEAIDILKERNNLLK